MWGLIAPIAVIEFALLAFALRDLINPERRVKGGNKLAWAIAIVIFGFIGPLAYFVVGREDM